MKKLTLTVAGLFFVLSVFSQAVLYTEAPQYNNSTTTGRLPNGTSNHTSHRAVMLVLKSELTAISVNTLIKRLGMSYNTGTNGLAQGNFKIYLQNTTDATFTKATTDWSTIITDMTQVYNGNYVIPNSSSAVKSDIILNTSFNYTGNALYVAFDYLGAQFTTNEATYRVNSDVLNPGLFNGTSTTATPPTTLSATAFRPCLLFGYDNPYQNDIEISYIDNLGTIDKTLTNKITARVKNKGAQDQVDIAVTATITGANSFLQTINISSLAAGASTEVVFNTTNANSGTQIISVTVPNDELNTNNILQKTQNVDCGQQAYFNATDVHSTSIGFNTGEGLMAVKYQSSPLGIKVSSAVALISDDPANVGQKVAGVLLDANGAILAETPLLTITNEMLSSKVVFNFPSEVSVAANTYYYVALKQTASANGYYPLGTFSPNNIPPGRCYTFAVTGGVPGESNILGTFMIGCQFNTSVGLSSSVTNPVNSGTDVTFTASSNFDQYVFKVDDNVVQNSSSNTYTYQPTNNQIVSVEASLNGCAAPVASVTIQINQALPINLSAFTVKREQSFVKLNWQTQTETNNKEFIISHSVNGSGFVELGKVTGAVNSDFAKNYQFIDHKPQIGLNYYRLQQIDLNGKLTDLGVKKIEFNLSGNNFNAYPNPLKNLLNVDFASNVYNLIELFDINGKLIYQNQLSSKSQSHQINLTNFHKGVYVFVLKGNQAHVKQKVVKD